VNTIDLIHEAQNKYDKKLNSAEYQEGDLISNVYLLATLLEKKDSATMNRLRTIEHSDMFLQSGLFLNTGCTCKNYCLKQRIPITIREEVCMSLLQGRTIKSLKTIVIIFLFLTTAYADGDTPVTIYTPEGKPLLAYVMGAGEIWFDDEDALNLIYYYGLDAEILESSTLSYNCHGYAWAKSENMGNILDRIFRSRE